MASISMIRYPFSFDLILNTNPPGKYASEARTTPTNPASNTNEAISISYASKQYTDLLLVCKNNIEIPVHKVMVCPQCTFISNACKKPWAKTKPNDGGAGMTYVDFSSEPLEAVKQTVEFFYKGDYTDTPIDPSTSSNPTFHHGVEKLKQHAEVHILASKYLIPTLQQKSLTKSKHLQFDHPKSTEQSPALIKLAKYIYDNTTENSELRDLVAKMAARYAKHILEKPSRDGFSTFTAHFNTMQRQPCAEEMVQDYIAAIAEKDEGLAECMHDSKAFGMDIVEVLRWNPGLIVPLSAPLIDDALPSIHSLVGGTSWRSRCYDASRARP